MPEAVHMPVDEVTSLQLPLEHTHPVAEDVSS